MRNSPEYSYSSFRAYIAASRRSDRSLEARVESARRASEIHKRRTGRSLRVTEQDVVNEEMYEEEDDDLPAQYRRLTAHLNTNSSDFNRRLATYLTSHVAMRQALDQALSSSYAQSGQTMSPTATSAQQSPNTWLQNQAMFGQQFSPTPTMIQPSMMHQSPRRHTPYPMPSGSEAHTGRPKPASISTAQQGHAASTPASALTSPMANFNFDHGRRTSAPAPNVQDGSNSGTDEIRTQPSNSPSIDARSASLNAASHTEPASPAFTSFPNAEVNGDSHPEPTSQQLPNSFVKPLAQAQQSPWSNSPSLMTPVSSPFGPFSTSLPPETQMFFGQGFNFDQMNQQPFYSYNPNIANHKQVDSSAFNGMSQTLAPEAFSSKFHQTAWPTPPSLSSDDVTSPFTAMGNAKFGNDAQSQPMMPVTPGISTDGQLTPADEFSALIDSSLWDNEATA